MIKQYVFTEEEYKQIERKIETLESETKNNFNLINQYQQDFKKLNHLINNWLVSAIDNIDLETSLNWIKSDFNKMLDSHDDLKKIINQ